LKVGYLDDITLAGDEFCLSEDIEVIIKAGQDLGLQLNFSKCEIISTSGETPLNSHLSSFIRLTPSDGTLLGASLTSGRALEVSLSARKDELNRAAERLTKLASHDALTILRYSLSAPKLMHTLRSSPCFDHPMLTDFEKLFENSCAASLTVI
jgi:hypothetical protein